MNVKRKCPQCSHKRTNKTDKPLSYDTERRIFLCHHCGWSGKDKQDDYIQPRKTWVKPSYTPVETATPDKLTEFFKGRGIPAEVISRNKIEVREVYFPQTENTHRAIAFPYFRDGEIVNVKYRDKDKNFVMEKGAEMTLYGLDSIRPGEPLVWVEGEMDKLALEAIGVVAVSVPNGSGTNLDILAAVEDKISKASHHVIAGDADESGLKLQAEIIRRLGAERCWRAAWPDDCKDANETLIAHGEEGVRDALAEARPVPIDGIFELDDVWFELLDIYRNGRPPGEDVGWPSLKKLYRPRLRTWTVVTGSPSSGKSSFLRAMFVNLAMTTGWRFLVFPPEDCPAEEYYSLLMELFSAEPFEGNGVIPRMSEETLETAADWIKQYFYVMNPSDGERDFDSLLSITKSMIMRRGINSVVLDPWNRIEHFMPTGMDKLMYVQKCLSRFDSFIKLHNLHGYIVAHPTKLRKELDGSYPVATLYDISGSADWFNMCDFGLSVWRDKADRNSPVEVHVQKVRHRWCGETGMAPMYWDRVTGRFGEEPYIWSLPEAKHG